MPEQQAKMLQFYIDGLITIISEMRMQHIIIITIIHTFLYCHKVVTSAAVYSPKTTAFASTKLYFARRLAR